MPVFVKRVPLADRERVRSTANLFGLPLYCQYGVGSPGFGAWRELAAHTMTTDWLLAGRTEAFPYLHHWRVLPGAPPPAAENADIEGTVADWGGSPAVRDRLIALSAAPASVVLFLEHLPVGLPDWLDGQFAAGTVESACAMVERCLRTDFAFLAANEFLHFDAHFDNIRTDGERLYYGDLGLATAKAFELSAVESAFVDRHVGHDLAYVLTKLVNWLVVNECGIPAIDGAVARDAYVRACAAGERPGAPALVRRYAPVAAVLNDFYRDLFGASRATPYPADRVDGALAAVGSGVGR